MAGRALLAGYPWLQQCHRRVMTSQITSNQTVCSTTCSGYQQRKHQSSALLALCESGHWWISLTNGQQCRKYFHGLTSSWSCMQERCLSFMNSEVCLCFALIAVLFTIVNRPILQIPEYICAISHNASFCNRNVHMCAHLIAVTKWCIVEKFQPLIGPVFYLLLNKASANKRKCNIGNVISHWLRPW